MRLLRLGLFAVACLAVVAGVVGLAFGADWAFPVLAVVTAAVLVLAISWASSQRCAASR